MAKKWIVANRRDDKINFKNGTINLMNLSVLLYQLSLVVWICSLHNEKDLRNLRGTNECNQSFSPRELKKKINSELKRSC